MVPYIQRVASARAARLCHIVFEIIHWLVGRYCSYLLPKQGPDSIEKKILMKVLTKILMNFLSKSYNKKFMKK